MARSAACRASAEETMGYRLATLGLAPILVAQGRYVRRVTPRLPEAAGPRSGARGAGPTLRLLILGDSAAAGVGVSTQSEALSGQLLAALGDALRVHWRLSAQSGHAAQDLVRHLETASTEQFDVALVSVGVNDVTGRTSASDWCARLSRLIGLLQTKFGVRYVLLTSLPPLHAFPALPQPLRWYLGARATQLDCLLAGVAAGHAHCHRLALRAPVASQAVAADGFHPGASAYTAWAQLAAAAIRTRIEQGKLPLES